MNRNPLTTDEQDYIRRNHKTRAVRFIADDLSRSPKLVYQFMVKNKLKVKAKSKPAFLSDHHFIRMNNALNYRKNKAKKP